MHEENDPIVLDGTVANALLTRFFGKEDGKKHALDLSIKVRPILGRVIDIDRCPPSQGTKGDTAESGADSCLEAYMPLTLTTPVP